MTLAGRLKAQIRDTGPLTVAQYMTACLHDPLGGYYATRPAIGADGDFITAPMVSQMFGELVGLWVAEVWAGVGRPKRVIVAEMGPGDGTLISDVLRAGRAEPGFLDAVELWLVDTSPPLRALQEAKLADAAVTVRWTDGLEGLPTDAPLILVANELLDCLPAQQFLLTERGWAQRMVGLDADGELAFGLLPAGGLERIAPEAPIGSVLEVSPAQAALGAVLGARIGAQGGAALLIDYGRDAPGPGDTLQALIRHAKVSPLERPGEADLTVHADFPAVLAAARAAGAAVTGILGQGDFLRRLGIEARAVALAKSRPDMVETLARQLERLTGEAQMGRLFKACAIHAPDGPVPPGFEGA